MLPILKKLKEENRKKKVYSRILSNRMTILAWHLFRSNRILHYGFLLYRLKRDFGFTDWEIANFTGMPINTLIKYRRSTKNILDSEILKVAHTTDIIKELENWYNVPYRHKGESQGYYQDGRELPDWLNAKKSRLLRTKEPDFHLGDTTDKDLSMSTQKFN